MRTWTIIFVVLASCATDARGSDDDARKPGTVACLTFNAQAELVTCLEINLSNSSCAHGMATSGFIVPMAFRQQEKCPLTDPEPAGFCEQPLSGDMVARSFSYDTSDAGIEEARSECEKASLRWFARVDEP
jgi:hypothetical protein